jgi:hypothetical protein
VTGLGSAHNLSSACNYGRSSDAERVFFWKGGLGGRGRGGSLLQVCVCVWGGGGSHVERVLVGDKVEPTMPLGRHCRGVLCPKIVGARIDHPAVSSCLRVHLLKILVAIVIGAHQRGAWAVGHQLFTAKAGKGDIVLIVPAPERSSRFRYRGLREGDWVLERVPPREPHSR